MTGVVTYERVWWVMGPVPQDLRARWPQDVIDPPSSGWHGVLVYRPNRSDAKYAQVFDPATGWGRDVALESMELNGAKQINDWDETKMVGRIRKTCERNDRLGVSMSYGKANFMLEHLGVDPFERTSAAEEEATEPKARELKAPKVDARAGLVQASDIAAKLGIEARDLRNACRKLKIEKPALGWAGPQVWADDIEKRVRAFLAAEAAPEPTPPPATSGKKKKK